jgi:hypothetical protein
MSVAEFFSGVFQEAAGRVRDDVFAEGYGEAAEICIGVLSERIYDVSGQLKDGLSEKDQFLLSSLLDIRTEAEAALRRRAHH